MEDIVIRNIGDLMETIRRLDERGGKGQTMWYRGHGNSSWPTIPSVQRQENYSEQLERQLVNNFRIRAAQILQNAPAKDNYSAWMSLMQHYGLATRLMDWSKSPLIAAYFATEKKRGYDDADACIWILWPSELNKDQIGSPYVYPIDSTTVEEMLAKAFKSPPKRGNNDERYRMNDERYRMIEREKAMRYRQRQGKAQVQVYDSDDYQPLGYGCIVACEPVENNLRMYSQQACFTVHDTKRDGNGYTYPTLTEVAERIEENNLGTHVTARLIIPSESKRTFRRELGMLGITESFIYPDMDHLSKDIKKKLLER